LKVYITGRQQNLLELRWFTSSSQDGNGVLLGGIVRMRINTIKNGNDSRNEKDLRHGCDNSRVCWTKPLASLFNITGEKSYYDKSRTLLLYEKALELNNNIFEN